MLYTELGKTGIRVSKLGLGGAPLGGDFGPTTDKEVENVVHAAIDMGITFFDTAPLYGSGESERRLGLALKGRRDKIVLATKAVMRGDPYTYDNTIKSVEQSLIRLQTDCIDLIQLHELESTSYEQVVNETLPAFRKLKEQGKVRAIGINAGKMELLTPFMDEQLCDTIQTFGRYTLIDYTAADDLLIRAKRNGIGVIHGSPLNMGILADQPAPFFLKYVDRLNEANRRMDKLEFLREGRGLGSLVEPAMRFCLSNPDIAVTLTGTTSVEVLQQNVAYCDGVGLTPEQQSKVLALFPGQPF
ncbi:MAG: oxidoreductase [Paenibacillus sp.]|nr:oxidoreductase [Paenibacillus sp.]